MFTIKPEWFVLRILSSAIVTLITLPCGTYFMKEARIMTKWNQSVWRGMALWHNKNNLPIAHGKWNYLGSNQLFLKISREQGLYFRASWISKLPILTNQNWGFSKQRWHRYYPKFPEFCSRCITSLIITALKYLTEH